MVGCVADAAAYRSVTEPARPDSARTEQESRFVDERSWPVPDDERQWDAGGVSRGDVGLHAVMNASLGCPPLGGLA